MKTPLVPFLFAVSLAFATAACSPDAERGSATIGRQSQDARMAQVEQQVDSLQLQLDRLAATAQSGFASDSLRAVAAAQIDSIQSQLRNVREAVQDSVQAAITSQIRSVRERMDRFVTSSERGLSTDSLRTAAASQIDSVKQQLDVLKKAVTGRQLPADWWAKLILSVLLVIGAMWAGRGTAWLLEFRAERSASRRLIYKKLIPLARIVIWSFAIWVVVKVVYDLDNRTLLAAGTAVGVAVGFAAQDTLKNVFGGLLILLDQPFQVGDKVKISGTYGEVVSIGLRWTRIVTPDDSLVTVPNSQVVADQVSNANSGALDCQVVTEMYLPGWVDVAMAKKIAYDAATTSKFVYLEKPIVVLVRDHFDHGFLTKIIVKAYVLDTRYEFVFASDVTERAKVEYLRLGMLQPMYLRDFVPASPENGSPDGGAASQ